MKVVANLWQANQVNPHVGVVGVPRGCRGGTARVSWGYHGVSWGELKWNWNVFFIYFFIFFFLFIFYFFSTTSKLNAIKLVWLFFFIYFFLFLFHPLYLFICYEYYNKTPTREVSWGSRGGVARVPWGFKWHETPRHPRGGFVIIFVRVDPVGLPYKPNL